METDWMLEGRRKCLKMVLAVTKIFGLIDQNTGAELLILLIPLNTKSAQI